MYLKRIEIQGFKSFAEKINMDFDLGVTCIVGPNGSGKSNISDCVRWVLGEQSAKNLRGGKMEDVIFVGTQYRKSMGFAKVSLILDNQDESLPIDYSEVVITRKLYRSGESEFFINNNQCRLKDIHELLMDTGIGRDGYSIIGQGRVDEILSAKSDDRRAIFEEASGIVKYKTRKNEALKKLEQTSQNLERINDTISMLESQLEPLKVQSKDAQKYLELSEELKHAMILSYIDRISKAYEQQGIIKKEHDKSYNLVEEEEKNLSKAENLYKLLNVNLQDITKELEDTKNMFYQNESNQEKVAYQIKIDEEKVNSSSLNIFRLKDEINKLKSEIQVSKKENKINQEKLKKLEQKGDKDNLRLQKEETLLEKMSVNLTDKQREMEKLNDNYLEKLNEKTIKSNLINNMSNVLQSIDQNKEKISKEIEKNNEQVEFYSKNKETIINRIKENQDSLIKKSEKIKDLEEEIKKTNKSYEENTKKLNDIIVKINSDVSSCKFLKDLEENLEGYTKSVKVILKMCSTNKEFGRGVHGALLKLIEVPEKMEIAIEVALGNALQYIVTDTENEAKRIIEYLKSNNLGRATFLPISSVYGKEFEQDKIDKIENTKGFVGFAHKVISYDPKYHDIIVSFLGKIVIVSDLQAGIEMAKKFNYKFKIVTLKGEFLNIGGSITGGSTNKKETGMMSRGRKITELEAKISEQKKEESNLRKDLDCISKLQKDKQKELELGRVKQKEYEMTLLKDISYKERLEDDVKKYNQTLKELREEKKELLNKEEETKQKYEKDKENLALIEKEIEEIQASVLQNKEKHKTTLIEREKLQGIIMQMKIDINKNLEAIQNLGKLIEKEDSIIQNLEANVLQKQKEKDDYENSMKDVDKNIKSLKEQLKKECETKQNIYEELSNIENKKKDKEVEIEDSFTSLQKVNKNIIILKEEFNKIDAKKLKVEEEINYLKDKLWEEYELTYQNALNQNKDNKEKVSQKKIQDLKIKIKELGNVNISAIEEYKKIQEHYDFMSEQRDDMEKSTSNLKKVIVEITQVMKEQFIEQFKIINENFNIVFNELFEGGRAKLVLEDENNVLESGIQIHVQPPGKKLQNMMLLSGGERAFTAIALLFAIIKLRPAPFCILDEIEAALDDANVYKFADYVKRHINMSQFILITHRKGTMEVADTLYGVTMQEQGISKVVSLKLDALQKK